MDNFIFIGMPASGKSSVGAAVAKKLGYRFIDTDDLIREQEGKPLKEIIDEVGNEGFLEIENRINRELQAEKCVISPGGSVIYCREAMEHYREIGTIIYLSVSFVDIRKRIRSLRKRGVVLKPDQTFRDLYRERTALYRKYANITVDETGFRREETVENVIKAIRKYQKKQKHGMSDS